MLSPETSVGRRAAFRRLLERETGTAADARAIGAGAGRLFEHLAHELAPLIGESGVSAVFGRSVYLARPQLPWLPPASPDGTFTSMQEALQHQDPGVATEATLLVLVTVSEQLASLIGERLTSQFLSGAWPDDFADGGTPGANP